MAAIVLLVLALWQANFVHAGCGVGKMRQEQALSQALSWAN
jgi:hypothetical protein